MNCSVCALSDPTMMGGVLLWERNGLISAICSDCWNTFSLASPSNRVIKNKAQREALQVRKFFLNNDY